MYGVWANKALHPKNLPSLRYGSFSGELRRWALQPLSTGSSRMKNVAPISNPSRLIKSFVNYHPDDLGDFLLFAAREIEDSMMQAGAIPGVDYTLLDIYKLAVQVHGNNKK